jgi:hypothetical protein
MGAGQSDGSPPLFQTPHQLLHTSSGTANISIIEEEKAAAIT